jgi:hypothetical protein
MESATYNYKYSLINFTAIASDGRPITAQVRKGSLNDVERIVARWDADQDIAAGKVIRVFTNSHTAEPPTEVVQEWAFTDGLLEITHERVNFERVSHDTQTVRRRRQTSNSV